MKKIGKIRRPVCLYSTVRALPFTVAAPVVAVPETAQKKVIITSLNSNVENKDKGKNKAVRNKNRSGRTSKKASTIAKQRHKSNGKKPKREKARETVQKKGEQTGGNKDRID